ncbi:DUF4297 domain-containing protein [Myroides sp. TSA_177.3]|uniref:DUF4297 domain-containing protein n=1 Tax=Myroides sp. TSA_177.3 TaxID=3415650 RepID=UPI0040460376
MSELNPMLEVQREKSGSQTKSKYDYQYHWALYKVLNEHLLRKEYAVFVELHEDVIISDSLDSSLAKFEFNQIKTTSKNMSHNELTKLKNKVKGTSVLAKLVSNANGKTYSMKIDGLNLVSVFPFTLELKKKGLQLDKITLEELSESQYKKLEEAIKNELGKEILLPQNLQFIVSSLSSKNYQNDVIASISRLIEEIYPESYCKPNDIYRLLLDEINTKGTITYDFSKWEELLEKKALTSITISKVINKFTSLKDDEKIKNQFDDIAKELGLNTITSRKLKQSFTNYRLTRLGNKSVFQLGMTKNITKLINEVIDDGENNFKELIEKVSKKIDEKYNSFFIETIDLEAAIICEYIYNYE